MTRRTPLAILALAVALCLPAHAQYDYGSKGSGGGAIGGQGFVLLLEAMNATANDTDTVMATSEGLSQVLPQVALWDDEFAGRLGLGYRWASGNKVMVTAWSYSADTGLDGLALPGQTFHFAIGPPIPFQGGYVGDTGGAFSSTAEIEAASLDVMFGREHEISEGFLMEWGLGLQAARFEENQDAAYLLVDGFDNPTVPLPAFKTIESDMFGAKVQVRGTYRFSTHWSVGAGLSFSFLQGDIETQSRLDPIDTINGQIIRYNEYVRNDTDRSGNIMDFDFVVAWHSSNDSVRVWLGWEQQRWDDIVADSARNFPGTGAPLQDRDSIGFSGLKLGVRFVF